MTQSGSCLPRPRVGTLKHTCEQQHSQETATDVTSTHSYEPIAIEKLVHALLIRPRACAELTTRKPVTTRQITHRAARLSDIPHAAVCSDLLVSRYLLSDFVNQGWKWSTASNPSHAGSANSSGTSRSLSTCHQAMGSGVSGRNGPQSEQHGVPDCMDTQRLVAECASLGPSHS